MATEYRKRLVSDTWHFCSHCSQWPVDKYISSSEVPRNQAICNECIVKNQRSGGY
jgi:hypothetical protein